MKCQSRIFIAILLNLNKEPKYGKSHAESKISAAVSNSISRFFFRNSASSLDCCISNISITIKKL